MSYDFDELDLPIIYEEDNYGLEKIKPILSKNAHTVLRARYLKKNVRDEITESPQEMLERVAMTVAASEMQYGGKSAVQKYYAKFYNLLARLDFLPNSPTLMNASRGEGQLSACFVLPVGDSMPDIFEAVKHAALIQKSGGGVGYSFSQLRPVGDRVKTTNGVSSGPISFMKVFNEATETVKQGGRRRGANMGVLRIDHPDILDFIDAKKKDGTFYNFNISVAVTDAFMEALERDATYPLINPRTGKKDGSLPARQVWERIIRNAWENAEPGILFIDRINCFNPTPALGTIESTNPCGEACLLPYEACNLGSINLNHFVHNKAIDYQRLGETVRMAVRFLDDVIDVNQYVPLIPKIKQMTRSNRKIGLGIMGFADMLISLGISYRDERALRIADQVMSFISQEGKKASIDLAGERGSFPNWRDSIFHPQTAMRNATVTSIAPTGTLSIIAGCSPGIEPLFGVCFERNVLGGEKLLEVHPLFEKIARKEGFYSEELMKKITGFGTIQDIEEIPQHVRELFVTSHDIPGETHVLMQAAFQKHVDMSVSKTINLPSDATREDVDQIYRLAYKNGLKGLTVYRYGSREGQVIVLGKSDSGQKDENNKETRELKEVNSDDRIKLPTPYLPGGSNGGNGGNKVKGPIKEIPSMFNREIVCPECGQGTLIVGACSVCQHCGYSKCG